MPKVTVIMPSLNVAPYIEECIQSVRNQTLQDIEIIVVDAGSTDGTLEKLEQYQMEDSRIKLHITERKSYGYQVNWGIDHAKGEYMAIIETDDCIVGNMLEILYEVACETGADYVKGNHDDVVYLPDGEVWRSTRGTMGREKPKYDQVIVPREHPALLINDIYLWKGIYRREFVKKHAIRLNETEGAAFQDIGFLFQTIGFAGKAVYVEKSLYWYRRTRMEASSYNANGFSYLVGEYEFVERIMNSHPQNFELLWEYYYGKVFNQCASRVKVMAAGGQRWKNIEEAVGRLHEKLREAFQKRQLYAGISGTQSWLETMMFLEDPEKYFDSQFYIYHTKRSIVKTMLEEAEKSPAIIMFGCGKNTGFVNCLLQKNGVKRIEAFCDNDAVKWNTRYMGKKVIAVEEAAEKYAEALFIIAAPGYAPEMKKQLLHLGIKPENIYIYGLGVDLLLLNM